MRRTSLAALLVVSAALSPAGFSACGPAAVPPTTALAASASGSTSAVPLVQAEPPEGPVATLRSGELAPVDHKTPVQARVVARYTDNRFELLAVELVLPINAAFDSSERQGSVVRLEPAVGPYAFAALPDDVSAVERRGLATSVVWIRRPREQEKTGVTGVLYTPQLGADPGHKVPFVAEMDPKVKSDPQVVGRWAAAFAGHLRGLSSGPWHQFAATRVEEIFGDKKKQAKVVVARPRRPSGEELGMLMETTTGMLSVQEALQHDRPLLLAAAKEKHTTPIAKLVGPKLAAHPWDEMLRGLSSPPPTEPLATAAPAEFWYLRAADLPTVFRMADQLDAWGTPAANLMDGNLEERDLARRYETQLGLARTELGRALGKEVIESVAFTGSDPYLREGSDVTAIFAVKQSLLFNAALVATLAAHAKAHGGVTSSNLTYEGASIVSATSADGAVHQYRTTLGTLAIVSNSLAATKGVIDAFQRKRPRLADEMDFRYMLARDASTPADVLGFFGDKFVAEAVGPRQKVLEARRQIATAELMTPGFAALLYGWIYGKSPASVDDLVASKLLRKEELKHANGTPIAWRPAETPRSPWGTPSALTPLIDVTAPDSVSEAEKVAYERFSRTYESYWSGYIDPAMLRLSTSGEKGSTILADLRILPLIEGTDYRDIRELAGQARVKAPSITDGLRAVVGIGPTAGVRRELASLAGARSGRFGVHFDFLGDWAMVGTVDRPRIADVTRRLTRDLPQMPASSEDREDMDEIAEAARMPAYAAVEIRSVTAAGIALAEVRKLGESVFHDQLIWTESGSEGGRSIVRIGVKGEPQGPDGGKDVLAFYALTDKALFVALDERVLRVLVRDAAEGRGPVSSRKSNDGDGAQLVVDLAGDRQGGLFTVLSWFLSQAVIHESGPGRAHAEALLRGAPERTLDEKGLRALALACFGAVPMPPHGGAYSLGPDGVRDPFRGTASFPRWPALPVPGSMVDKLLGSIGRFRSEIAFDPEGRATKDGRGMQSLHVRATIGLRE
jgi:hypothetical protein